MKKISVLFISLFMFFVSCSGNFEDAKNKEMKLDFENQLAQVTDVAKSSTVSKVFMTTNITSEGLMKVYNSLNRPAKGKVAIKIHMGEPGNKNYISPNLIRDITLQVNGTFVDANVYYGGPRSTVAGHLQAAKDHGFTYAPVDILDAEGEVLIPIKNGTRLKEAVLGSHYTNYNFIISIAHFKGHSMAGFGGTFKNLAIGMATPKGKGIIHRNQGGGAWSSSGEVFLEKVAEYTKAVADDKKDNIVYINVLNNLSVDCDCAANAAHPLMNDIGILASLDPVALDKASVDLIYKAPREESRHLISRIESRKGTHLLDYAEKLGMGSQKYELVLVK